MTPDTDRRHVLTVTPLLYTARCLGRADATHGVTFDGRALNTYSYPRPGQCPASATLVVALDPYCSVHAISALASAIRQSMEEAA